MTQIEGRLGVTQIDPNLHTELIASLGEPPMVYQWWKHKQDYIPPTMTRASRFLPYTMRGGRTVTIAAEDLGITDLHSIPGNSRSWMYLYTSRLFSDTIDNPRSQEAIVMLEGYRIGYVEPVEDHRGIRAGSDGTRGIWRTYALNPEGQTWVYEMWTEWVENQGWGCPAEFGKVVTDQPIPENLWERTLELAQRPTKTVADRMEQAISELHPELQIGLANLIDYLTRTLRGKFEVPYKGFRRDLLERDVRKYKEAIEKLEGDFNLPT